MTYVKLARVIGTVVATIKDPSLEGEKILMIQPLTDDLKNSGDPLAAIDSAKAGNGDLVHWIMSREASLALPNSFSPIDAAITGIVDHVNPEDPGIEKNKIFQTGEI